VEFAAPERSPEPSPGCSQYASLPAERQTWTFEQDGQHRTTFVDAPAAPAGTPLPVVLSFHPFALGNQAWDDYSKMAATATSRGYVVVTPQGSTDLLLPRWTVRGGLPGPDDPAFVDQILTRLGDEGCIDLSRVYATGFSAGAAFSVSLTCERPGLLAAVAVSGGSNLSTPCPEGDAVDALIMHGLEDPIAPPSGQAGPLPPQGISVQEVVDSFATRGDCSGTTTLAVRPSANLVRSTGCVPGGETAYLPFTGGHTWAGKDGLAFAAIVTGATNYDFDATLTALDWFDTH
jgi:polyhydroxybutyrate depolymerase